MEMEKYIKKWENPILIFKQESKKATKTRLFHVYFLHQNLSKIVAKINEKT